MKPIGYKRAEESFRAEHILFWSNLSRMNSLLIVLNISLYFMTIFS